MQFDLVAIGGGFSGLSAACRAAELGLNAAVLEQSEEERYLCSSRYSNGTFTVMRRAVDAPPDVIFDAIMKETDGVARPELARAIADNAKRAVDWIIKQGGRFTVIPRANGTQHVLAPARRYREGLDWEGRGADMLLRCLEQRLLERGGELLRGTRAEALLVEDDACIGIAARRRGESVRIGAKAVVIADGGFPASADMVRRYIAQRADRVLVRAPVTVTGDGIRMAEAAGAALGGFGPFYGHIHHRDAMINNRLWPYPLLDRLAESGIVVGSDGKRFTDEGLGGVCIANAIARLDDPLSAVAIFDDAIWNGAPGAALPVAVNPTMMSGGGWLFSADDLSALADKAGLPAAALSQAVSEHNAAVSISNFVGLVVSRTTTEHQPMPIATPPFHAVPLCAGITGTMGGIVINAHAQALRPDRRVFAGLYAAGTPVCGLEGGARVGYVGGLCKAFVLGLLAAEHSASVIGPTR